MKIDFGRPHLKIENYLLDLNNFLFDVIINLILYRNLVMYVSIDDIQHFKI